MNDIERRQLAAMWEWVNLGPMSMSMSASDAMADQARIWARHGFAPDGTTAEKPGLKYAAEIVQRSEGNFDVMHGGRYLGWDGDPRVYKWRKLSYPDNSLVGNFDTGGAALAALNAAPPPPGWVEPTRAEATGVCAKCYGTWMSSEHACPNCGRLAGKCLKCEGTGWWRNEPTADEGVKCPDCHGTGIRSFERPPPAPQPASEGVRWFFRKSDGLVWEGTFKGGRWLNSRGGFHQETRLYPEFFQKDADNYTELDGPLPHGKPLAKPATEGDELKERYFVWARQAPERKYESWADAVPFARSEIARATAPLVKERDKLRAKLARLKPTRRKSKPRKGKGVKRGR